jgi:hypothetical protein
MHVQYPPKLLVNVTCVPFDKVTMLPLPPLVALSTPLPLPEALPELPLLAPELPDSTVEFRWFGLMTEKYTGTTTATTMTPSTASDDTQNSGRRQNGGVDCTGFSERW